jgi:sensor histidine kinase YesM
MIDYIRSFFTFFSYRKKLSIVFMSFLILPMMAISFLLIRHNIFENEKSLLEYHRNLTERCMTEVADVLESGLLRIFTINRDSRLQVYLFSSDNDLVRLVQINYYLEALYETLIFGMPGMEIKIYRSVDNVLPGRWIYHINDMNSELLAECISLPHNAVMLKYGADDYLHLYTVVRKFSQSDLYIIEVMFPFSHIEQIFDELKLYNKLSAVYWTSEGVPVTLVEHEGFSNRDKFVFEYKLTQAQMVIRSHQNIAFYSDVSDFKPEASAFGSFVFYVSNVQLYDGVVFIILLLIGLFLSVLLLVILTSRRLTYRLYRVIEQTKCRFEERDDVRIKLSEKRGDEFYFISSKLNELFETIHIYYEEKKELETQLLQDLINPHFLYNTLDSIKRHDDKEKVVEVVDMMIDYYRASLNKGMLYVTIGNEIKTLSEYVMLQQFAYESEFRFILDVSPDIVDLFTINHILQPFVENAILHGIEKSSSIGMIIVRGYKDARDVVFEIEDNGCGIKEEHHGFPKGGYGISNVRKRIINQFGNEFGVSFSEAIERGTIVQVRIPQLSELPSKVTNPEQIEQKYPKIHP